MKILDEAVVKEVPFKPAAVQRNTSVSQEKSTPARPTPAVDIANVAPKYIPPPKPVVPVRTAEPLPPGTFCSRCHFDAFERGVQLRCIGGTPLCTRCVPDEAVGTYLAANTEAFSVPNDQAAMLQLRRQILARQQAQAPTEVQQSELKALADRATSEEEDRRRQQHKEDLKKIQSKSFSEQVKLLMP